MKRIAIDPGEKHVGVAYDPYGHVDTLELNPEGATSWLDMQLMAGICREVVVESFKLFPGQDKRTVYRPMATSELIGAIKLLCSQHGVSVVEQDATIKKPTRRQLRARGIKQVGRGTHERDAELHYWYRKLREEESGA